MYQHNKIIKTVYNNLIKSLYNSGRKYDCDKRSHITLCFTFDWAKDVDQNLKHEIEFIIKSNESLAEDKIKNEIKPLLLKYKHGNNIHENRKQQNK